MTGQNASAKLQERYTRLSRREWLAYSVAGTGMAAAATVSGAPHAADARERKRYAMKKSINLWALPYPEKMDLKTCFEICAEAGFDGVEVNYDLDSDISPAASEDELRAIGDMARGKGLEIAGVCSYLFWPYPFTHEDAVIRERAIELGTKMIRAARLLGTSELLVVPGATYIPWMPEEPPVRFDVAEDRARQAIGRLLETAITEKVHLNLENIFINGFLHSPREMADFVDQFGSDYVRVHFDTGNIMQYHFPEHWIALLGNRIRHVHLKEFNRKNAEFNVDTFRPLLDGSTNWPAVLDALEAIGYTGYLTFEYFNPFPHHPEALVYYTSDALDRILGRK